MSRIERLKKITYQYRRPVQNTISDKWEPINYVDAAQSTLNAQVLDDTVTLENDQLPTTFLETRLDWGAEQQGDTIVKIEKEYIYVVQDLTNPNISKRQFISTPNLGIGYNNISYYGGIL